MKGRIFMDKYLENRFGYYRNNSNEELEIEKKRIVSEIDYLLHILDSNVSFEQKSEIRNSDLKFERDKLEYIDIIMKERKSKRSMNK